MTIFDVFSRFDDLNDEAKRKYLHSMFDKLVADIKQNKEAIESVLETLVDYEDDDYFGPEGMRL